jgi:hypothetical protein
MEKATMAKLFIGINGTVLAIERATEKTVWETPLQAGDFVNVLDGSELVRRLARGIVPSGSSYRQSALG